VLGCHRSARIYVATEAGFLIAVSVEKIPIATQIHHRNKGRGARLLDERWWMAISSEIHDRIEGNKDWARKIGLLLSLEADADGRLPDGSVCPTTDELLRRGEQKGEESSRQLPGAVLPSGQSG
jgi:hypothetical protein